MVTRRQVRVLLDTGPTEAEIDRIRELFDEFALDAVAEGHSYGGPPPTSAFLIVVTGPLVWLLDRFAARGGGELERLVRALHALRADERRWGRAHDVLLEDADNGHTVALPVGLPSAAYPSLLGVDLTGFDRATLHVRLEWQRRLCRWQVRLAAMPRPLARRAPTRQRGADPPWVRQVTEAEKQRLWRLVNDAGTPAVTWQRACVVLSSTLGWNVPSVARLTMLSERRVGAVIRNFNAYGFDSLDLAHTGGEAAVPTGQEGRDAGDIAARSPADVGLLAARWDPALLGEFLVTEGIVEDADLGWLEALLGSGVGGGRP
jgi:hypothetical protein